MIIEAWRTNVFKIKRLNINVNADTDMLLYPQNLIYSITDSKKC